MGVVSNKSRAIQSRILGLSPVILCLAASGYGQSINGGEIRGTLTDPSGAAVPNATVVVLNIDTGISRKFATNAAGLYDTVSLLPGRYRIAFSKPGFNTLVRDGITLQVGSPLSVDAQLLVGTAQESVDVTADALTLKTETAEQATNLQSQIMTELPNVSRSWANFTKMLPGVTGTGDAVTVNGTMPFYANFMLDGVSTTLPHSANVDLANFESLEEVQISTSTFSAQYGTGAVVYNQISKSGTNQWHGSAYEFVQNNALNARNFFSPSVPISHFNNFGGSVAGPIRKDRAFFYFNTEKIVNNSLSYVYLTYPRSDMLAGNFANSIFPTIYEPSTLANGQRTPFPGNRIPPSMLDPLALAVQKYFPVPTLPGYANNLLEAESSTSPTMKYFARGDYNFSANNRFTAEYTNSHNPSYTSMLTCPEDCTKGYGAAVQGVVSDAWTVSPTTVNEFRIGYAREFVHFAPGTLGSGYPKKIGWTYAEADMFPSVTIGGPVGATNIGSIGDQVNAIYAENVIDPSDTVTMIRGRHILHFGAELLFYQDNDTPWGNLNAGSFTFSGVLTSSAPYSAGGLGYADFLLGQVDSWNATNSPVNAMREIQPQVFAQDDFKVTPRLTVNLGLRYQVQGGWHELHNQLGSFDPALINPATGTAGAMWFAPNNGHSNLEATVHDVVLPRLGFSWSPRTNWVVRGGFGIYAYGWSQDTYTTGLIFNAEGLGASSTGSLAEPNQTQPTFIFSSSSPPLNYKGASKAPDAYNGQNASFFPYHTPVARNYQWSVSLQRQLPGGMLAEAAYTGNHVNGLAFPSDVNQVPGNALGLANPQNHRPFPQFLTITGTYYNAISNYDSLQASLKKRFSRGLSFDVNYTLSKMLDEQDSSGWTGNGGAQVYQSSYLLGSNYGLSNLNRHHMFKGAFVYQLPVGKGRQFLDRGGPANWALGGWQASTIFTVEAGSPFTPTMGTANLSGALSGNWYPNLVGNPGVPNRGVSNWFNAGAFAEPSAFTFGNSGRNILTGPMMSDIDFTIAKSFGVPKLERGRLQIRLDANNIINHPSFSNPGGSIGTPAAAVITSTSVAGRAIQLGARLSF